MVKCIKRILPQTEYIALQITIVVLSLSIASLGLKAILIGELWRILTSAFFIFPLAIGLWKLKEPVRKFINAVILFLVIVIPPGFINPFMAMDTGITAPAWELALDIYPWVFLGLVIVHILGKYKNEFTPLFKFST